MHLYILSEGEDDELFYERLAEQVTSLSFELNTELAFRARPGSNWKQVMGLARKLIQVRFSKWTTKQEIGLIIAVDNDRAPGHPGGRTYPRPLPVADQKKASRYEALEMLLQDSLGKDAYQWPVKVALAVPVEMVESWVLTLLDPTREELPPFAEAGQKTAHDYYGKQPPAQLKDLRDSECHQRKVSRSDLFWTAAEQPLEPAMKASRSLEMFVEQLRAWT